MLAWGPHLDTPRRSSYSDRSNQLEAETHLDVEVSNLREGGSRRRD